MRSGSLPPQSRIRPWFGAAEVAERVIPAARIPAIDPAYREPEPEVGIGAVGQPQAAQESSAFDAYRPPARDGMPSMSETTLIRAHRRCACHQEPEEVHSLAEWDEIETRQRAFAADPWAVASEGIQIQAALQGRKAGAA